MTRQKQNSKIKVILKEEVLLRDLRDALLSMYKLQTHFMDNELYLSKKKKKNKQTNKKKQEKKSEKQKVCNQPCWY